MPCFADIVLKCNKRIGKLILSDLIARFGKPRVSFVVEPPKGSPIVCPFRQTLQFCKVLVR